MRENIIKKVMVPAGFLAVVIIAVVVYVGLHRNKEASAPLNYSGIKGMNLENVPPNYWNTDATHKIAAAENGYYYITDETLTAVRGRLSVSCCHVITQVQFIWHSLVIMCMHLIREHILEVMWSIRSR